jgi:phage baseplate assembly protein gpV
VPPRPYDTLLQRADPKNDLTVANLSDDNAHITIQGSPERKVKKTWTWGGGDLHASGVSCALDK